MARQLIVLYMKAEQYHYSILLLQQNKILSGIHEIDICQFSVFLAILFLPGKCAKEKEIVATS